MPTLNMSREQERVAFYLFGRDTGTPCPDCKSGWGSRLSKSGVVTPVMVHAPDCAYRALDRKSLSKKGRGK